MVVPPQFSLAFKSVIYGTGVGLATTLLSCTLAVAVEKTAINYMYMYKVRFTIQFNIHNTFLNP